MSTKSLKEQLDGKPKKQPKASSNKWPLPVMTIVLAVVLILIIVILAVVINRYFKVSKQSVDNLPDLTYSEQAGGTYGTAGTYGSSQYGQDTASNAPGLSSDYGTGSSFQYGTVEGTTYHSAFSGITFTAPSNWTVRGGASSGQTSASAVLDLDASNPSGTMSVKMEYFSLSGGKFNSSSEVLAALKSGITTTKDNIQVQLGGHEFSGFIFRGKNGNSNAYSELLVADISGYAVAIQIIAPTTNDLTTILNMFS